MTQHLDSDGQPCTRHPASPQGLLALALLGSRMPSFHHDIATKLESLMLTLDEIVELSGSDLKQTATSANAIVRDLNALLVTNRALARQPKREPVQLPALIEAAAERSGVQIKGSMPELDVDIALPSITQAVAVILDLAAGPLKLGRTVRITVRPEAAMLVFVLAGPPTAMDALPPNGCDVLALATFALMREGGEVRCGTDRFTIKLPLAL